MFIGLAVSFNFLGPLSITGYVTGTANVTVGQTVDITLRIITLDFSSISIKQTNDTIDFNPPPFVLENSGNVQVNVTIGATDLWTGTGAQNPSVFYTYNTTRNETLAVPSEAYDFNTTGAVSNGTFTPMWTTGGASKVVNRLNFTDVSDAINVQINITASNDEPQGSKTSTVTFTASQS